MDDLRESGGMEWKLNVTQEEYDEYLDIVLKAAAQLSGADC